MKKGKFFVSGMLAAALTFGVIVTGCDNGTGPGDTFVAVTSITGVPTAAIKGTPLSLSGTVEPSNATNRTIVWSGASVSNGVLTATSAGPCTITATITNGTSASSPFTLNFTITVYDAGNGDDTNPFGDDTNPFIWVMDNTGGSVFATVEGSSWTATANGSLYNNGTYSRIGGIAAKWTVSGGTEAGSTGLAIIIEGGKLLVANFVNELSDMNGTFTKLEPGELTITGISKYDGNYAFAHTTSDDMEKGVDLLYAGKITITAEAVKITGGTVKLPVYKAEGGVITAGYGGSGTFNMDIVIMNSKVIPSTNTNHPDNWVANDEAAITFTNGSATLNGDTIDWDGDD
ncbi:MAG: hypothetical protein LBD96_09515 [Treponema sp.]|jgi:hypothetical protein|nr:hypothetical protein [Treponema sp.]